MPVTSAGLLVYRLSGSGAEVLIAHMGGPFWARKEEGAWSIPKGEYDPDGEDALAAAMREFREELGVDAPPGAAAELGTFAYGSGKRVTVFVQDAAGWDPGEFRYGEFEMEWPPRSGRRQSFPEVDRAEWTDLARARGLLVAGQRPAIDRLETLLAEVR